MWSYFDSYLRHYEVYFFTEMYVISKLNQVLGVRARVGA